MFLKRKTHVDKTFLPYNMPSNMPENCLHVLRNSYLGTLCRSLRENKVEYLDHVMRSSNFALPRVIMHGKIKENRNIS